MNQRSPKNVKADQNRPLPTGSEVIWYVPCPTCNARIGEYCRTPKGNVRSATHTTRTKIKVVRAGRFTHPRVGYATRKSAKPRQ